MRRVAPATAAAASTAIAIGVAAALVVFAASGAAFAQARASAPGAAPAAIGNDEAGQLFAVIVGRSRILAARDVVRVAVAEPSIADVVVASKTEIIVNGKAQGRTTLHVWDASGRRTFNIQVYADNEGIVREIEGAIGLAGVRARFARTTLVLDGVVATDAEARRAELIAKAYADSVVNLLGVENPAEPALAVDASQVQTAIGIDGVVVRVVRDTIILEGAVADPGASERAEKIARIFSDKVLNFLPATVEVIAGSQKTVATLSATSEATREATGP